MPNVPSLREFIAAISLRAPRAAIPDPSSADRAALLRSVQLTALELSFELAAAVDTAEFRVGAHSGLWPASTRQEIQVFDLVLAELAGYRVLLPPDAATRLDDVFSAWTAFVASVHRASVVVREDDLPTRWPAEERPHARLLACRDALLRFGGVSRTSGEVVPKHA
jgi:hypothetical protein